MTPDAARALEQRVTEALKTGHPRVVLDMRAVAVGGPADVCLFCVGLRRLSERGVRLTVLGLPPHVRRVVALCDIRGLEVLPAGPDDRPTHAGPSLPP